MKKIISMVLIAMLVLSFAAVGSATTLTPEMVDAADQVYVMSSEESEDIIVSATAENGVITVTYDSSVLETATDAQATIIIFNATTVSDPSAGNMIQIDQFDFDPEKNTYEYAYEPEEDGQLIVIMMGGTDIDKPGRTEIQYSAAPMKGDVVSDSGVGADGKIDINDAISILQYSVRKTVGGQPASEEFLYAADYDGDGSITMLDAIKIAYSIVLNK